MHSIVINNITFGTKICKVPSMNIKKNSKQLSEIKLEGYTAFIGGDVYTPSNTIKKQDLLFKDKKLIAIDDFDEKEINGAINYVILKNATIAPALIDQHIHGGYGISFHDSNETDIRSLLTKLATEGTGGVVATTLPGSLEHIKKQLATLNKIIKTPKPNEAKVYGIHMEGPFLNPQKSGIHPPEKLALPTIENYENLSPENVKIVTLAPELDKNFSLTKYLQEKGVIVSAGHTVATADTIIKSGIKQVTHLFNAMAGFHHRTPTVANEGLLNNEIIAEMNSEPSLLIPSTMNLIMKEKPKNKLILISDALSQAGIKEDFDMNGVKIHVADNWEAKSDDGVLAGSLQFLHNVVKKLITTTNMTFRDFIQYASINPAKNLKVQNDYKIKKGLEPNFTIWNNKTLETEKTFIK